MNFLNNELISKLPLSNGWLFSILHSFFDLGINDINSSSQLSLLSLENPYFMDVNNLYNNIFQGPGEDNLRQIMNHSNDNFFKSCLNVNGIYSSKNWFFYI